MSNARIQQIMAMIRSKRKESNVWTKQIPYNQPYYTFSLESDQWTAVEPSTSSTTSPSQSSLADLSVFSLVSWNIDFGIVPYPKERMLGAMTFLESYIASIEYETIIMFQEMIKGDLQIIQAQPWIRQVYNITDIDDQFWESGHYGTCTLIPKALPISNLFRVHYSSTNFERDGLFVDLRFGSGQRSKMIRLCNTHLESLVVDPPLRPHQLETAAKYMHESDVDGAVLAGDLNAIQPFDKTLHSQNNLQDAYLVTGGLEDDENGYTWGPMAPISEQRRFGSSRMDKILFCGTALQVTKFETFGKGVQVESEDIRQRLKEEADMAGGWVTDHLGVRADFKFSE